MPGAMSQAASPVSNATAERLGLLRAELARAGLAGFIVPISDEHMSEYVGAYAQRLAWLTGFLGSAGTAAVLADSAAIAVDGRYTVQVRAEVPAHYDHLTVPAQPLADWAAAHVRSGDRIGYDPWLHGKSWVDTVAPKLAAAGAELVPVAANPVDAIWPDRPAPSLAPVRVHPDGLAGRTSADKRAAIAGQLLAAGQDAAVVAALDSVAWLFNIRGRDVDHTPVARAFAVVHADATADLYVDPAKLTPEVVAHLGPEVRTHAYGALPAGLDALAGQTVRADPQSCVAAIFTRLTAAGARIVEGRDPCVLPKAAKTPAEIEGARSAHARDGAALTRFLHWLSVEGPRGQLDEISASDRLEAIRRESNALEDLSFPTISAAGPNGAIMHYRANPATNRRLAPNSTYLVDSGGQYADGTTDVTRTVAVGTPPPGIADRYTRVLKGHIALARQLWPAGLRGGQLDSLARQFLWSAGLDYAHGTGHGVGSYLSVHEGPARIAALSSAYAGIDEPLAAGMILSNEPGYYEEGAYGIRLENLLLVAPREVPGAPGPMLGFETLTLAPFDRALIEPALLNVDERAWLDSYHARVLAEIGPRLADPAARAWLERSCTPLATDTAHA